MKPIFSLFHTPRLVLSVIIMVGAALRFYDLGGATFWLDESWSWHLARLPWRVYVFEALDSEINMTAYYVVLRGWLVLGNSETVVRALSVAFGVAAIPAIYVLGKHLFEYQVGIVAAWLLTLHSFHIRASQEARSYSLVVLLLILSIYFFVRAVETPRRKKWWAWYVVCATLAVYAHAFAVFVLAAHVLALGVKNLRRVVNSSSIIAGLILALLTGLFLGWMVWQDKGNLMWVSVPTFRSMKGNLRQIVGNGRDGLLVTYILLCVSAIVLARRRRSFDDRSPDAWWRVRLFLVTLIFPYAAMFGFSFIKPILSERYTIIVVPGLVMLAAYGAVQLKRLRPRTLFPVALLLMTIFASVGLRNYYRERSRDHNEWRDMATTVAREGREGDGMIFHNHYYRLPFVYQVHRLTETNAAGFAPQVVKSFNHAVADNALPRFRRVWLVGAETTRFPVPRVDLYEQDLALIRARLEKDFVLNKRQTFRGVNVHYGETVMFVELYVREGDTD